MVHHQCQLDWTENHWLVHTSLDVSVREPPHRIIPGGRKRSECGQHCPHGLGFWKRGTKLCPSVWKTEWPWTVDSAKPNRPFLLWVTHIIDFNHSDTRHKRDILYSLTCSDLTDLHLPYVPRKLPITKEFSLLDLEILGWTIHISEKNNRKKEPALLWVLNTLFLCYLYIFCLFINVSCNQNKIVWIYLEIYQSCFTVQKSCNWQHGT